MEPKSTQSKEMIILIQDIMETIALGNTGRRDRWYIYFSNVLEQLNKPHDLKKLVQKMMPIFGGMGTFNDLVLHKDPTTMLDEENERLEILSEKLFILCRAILNQDNSQE